MLSWTPSTEERLHLSPAACLDGTHPIRGGIPVVFPQFGLWGLGRKHGFARNLRWIVTNQNDSIAKPTLNLNKKINGKPYVHGFKFESRLSQTH